MNPAKIRIFHPIGQGAFYSERHENGFNIVYDCGTSGKKSLGERLVKHSFIEDAKIDILFISHFDNDHVNMLHILAKSFKIMRVVLPLLYQDEINLLNSYSIATDSRILSEIINEPESFFKTDNIIRVKEGNRSGSDLNSESIQLENLGKKEINSGDRIMNLDWLFIPYNIYYAERHEALIELLAQNGIPEEDLTDPEYCIFNRDKLKAIYQKIRGDINQNSMLLYSGPAENQSERYLCVPNNHGRDYYHHFKRQVGCIYTGDSDLNTFDLTAIYKNNWENIGTIQIPHHGARGNFNKNILNQTSSCTCFPISHGVRNAFQHPHGSVITDIYRSSGCPLHVTDDLDSEFVQRIYVN